MQPVNGQVIEKYQVIMEIIVTGGLIGNSPVSLPLIVNKNDLATFTKVLAENGTVFSVRPIGEVVI